jgi:hypothetical protein
MYGKAPKMSGKKAMPVAIMVAVANKPKAMPKRGQRTATNMATKAKRGK